MRGTKKKTKRISALIYLNLGPSKTVSALAERLKHIGGH